MFQFVDETEPHVVVDGPGRVREDEGVVWREVVRDKAVVGAGELQLLRGLLVGVVIQQNVLLHPKVLSESELVKESDLLDLQGATQFQKFIDVQPRLLPGHSGR